VSASVVRFNTVLFVSRTGAAFLQVLQEKKFMKERQRKRVVII
jgi:hypothetical protein